jgi:prepilin-type processing-associated H-X9-DG protein
MMGDQLRTGNGRVYASHPGAGLKHFRSTTFYFYSAYRGTVFENMDRNFVFQDGHVETISGISGLNTGVTDPRFQEISNGADQAITGDFRAWAPFDD